MQKISSAKWLASNPSEGRQRWREEQRRRNIVRFSLVGLLGVTILAAAATFLWRQQAENVPLEFAGKTVFVRKGGSFQAALNQARAGDTIVLEAGASYSGSFELPKKDGAEFITIQSSALDKLPPENVRVAPEHAALMPKIVSSGNGEPAIKTAPAAHHYRFVGVEFTGAASDYVYNLVDLGADNYKTTEEFPHHFEFDRVYVHAAGLNKVRRGFALNNAETTIKNSYLAGFAGAGDETQAIACWAGAGKFKIINNHLAGGAENLLIGGGDPSIKDLVPSDIEIRGNFFTKPLEWRGKVTMKNTIELKNARRVSIVGNIIENCFDCGSIGLTVRNQNGTAPWSTIEDVEIRNNWIRRASSAINFLGTDDSQKSQRLKRVKIVNNLITEIDSVKWGNNSGGGYFVQLTNTEDVEVSHNTVFHDGNMITAYGEPNKRFVFNYNILSFNSYGVFGDTEGVGAAMIPKHLPGGVLVGNVVVNGRGIASEEFQFPGRNFLVQTFQSVGFTNWKQNDYRLKADSRFRGKAENGKDIGCNFSELNAAIAGVETSAQSY